jgi:hypothetical protein
MGNERWEIGKEKLNNQSHEGTWRKIMNKRDRNEDVSKSKVHSAPSPIPKQKEA